MPDCARKVAAAAAGAAGLLLLASCQLPDGVDGDLVSAWEPLPEPAGFTPDAGVCHPQDYVEQGPLAEYQPVSCDQLHRTETVFVGELSGEAAERVTPPTPGSSPWQDAYQQCEEGAAGYLGADFRHGRLWLGVTMPSVEAWEGGARWVRCDVSELDDLEESTVEREGSLADALLDSAGDSSSLTRGCAVAILDEATDTVDELEPVACDEPHDTEFVGGWRVDDDVEYPFSDDAWEDIHAGCRELVGDFADVRTSEVGSLTGTIGVPPTRADWNNGDRSVLCHLWLDGGREVTESLEGAGAGAFPELEQE